MTPKLFSEVFRVLFRILPPVPSLPVDPCFVSRIVPTSLLFFGGVSVFNLEYIPV